MTGVARICLETAAAVPHGLVVIQTAGERDNTGGPSAL